MDQTTSNQPTAADSVYDFVIVGSGFGGSVSAMRLTEKGYRVLVLERGKRYHAEDFPTTNWNVFKYLWLPALRCFGIMGINFLDDLMILNGSGVGGGSLVYASTHIEPGDGFYKASEWADLADQVCAATVISRRAFLTCASVVMSTVPNCSPVAGLTKGSSSALPFSG